MKRRFEGLHAADRAADEVPEGLFLVRVNRAQYRWHAQKPYYALRLIVIEPKLYVERAIDGRIYCTPKALWKLTWFLRDFGYDIDLLGHDEIDDKKLVGLRGVIKISRVVVNGVSMLNFEGFASAIRWNEFSSVADGLGSEIAS